MSSTPARPLDSQREPEFDAALEAAWWGQVLAEPPVSGESDPGTLTLLGQLDLLGQVQRERSRLAALEAELLVAVAGAEARTRQVRIDVDGSGADDTESAGGPGSMRQFTLTDESVDLIAAATRRSGGTVRRLVAQARTLYGLLPGTVRALHDGSISPEHADVLARTADGLEPASARRFEGRVLARARVLSPSETGVVARRERARIDTAGEEAARRRARRHVDVRVWAEDDGLACLLARLPIADAVRLHAVLEARAHSTQADLLVDADASMGERRAAVLVDAVCDPTATSTGVAVNVQVTADLAALVGLTDTPASIALGSAPAEPIAAAALRALLADPAVPVTLRRLVTDPLTGAPVDRGRCAYRVGDDLRAFITARDEVCAFPHCTRAAARCDIDHVQPWSAGGGTDLANLTPLCRRHHVEKTHANWTITSRHSDGTTYWRGPDGRAYVSYPLRLPPEPSEPPPRRSSDDDPIPF